jgi:hypothetical protein
LRDALRRIAASTSSVAGSSHLARPKRDWKVTSSSRPSPRQQPRRLAAMAMIGIAKLQRPLRHAVEAGEQPLRLEVERRQLRLAVALQRVDIARIVMIRRQRAQRRLPAHGGQVREGASLAVAVVAAQYCG